MNTVLTIQNDHPAFAGHFPSAPIMPGVVLLDEALFAIGAHFNEEISTCVLKTVKFLSPVRPGESVSIEFNITQDRQVRFTLHSGSRKVSTGTVCLPMAI